MAVVRKSGNKVATKVSAPVEKKAVTPKAISEDKKAVAKPATVKTEPKKASVSKKVNKPAATAKTESKKSSVAKKQTKGGKMGGIRLTPSKTPKTFEIKVGGQATQEAFIDRFYKKLTECGYELTKEQTKTIQKAYSETLKEVTEIASFQDTTSGIFYGRRIIKTRITNPPKAADGLQTLMLIHPEVKVRKQLADETKIKFFGQLSEEDPNIFITVDGEEINIAEAEEKLLAEYAGGKTSTKKASKNVKEEDEVLEDEVDVDEEEEVVEEDLIEDDVDADEEIEELEDELADDEDEEDLFDDEDEE